VHDLITLALRDDPELSVPLKSYDKLFEAIGGWGLTRADALVADSEWTRQDILRYLRVPPEIVHVGHLGIDHDAFRPLIVEPEFYARHGLQEGTPYVLYVGSEAPRKNLRRLVRAFARVVARVPEARLLKVGANPHRSLRGELKTLIEREGITGKVIFVEQTEDCDLARFYALARVFAFPSLYEGFGLPPLEAMACGTPVAASNRSCMPEILGDAALYFDPYEIDEIAASIIRLLEDSQLRLAARARGLGQAALFNWDRTAANALSVDHRVL
jgi:glycosyltransferase involved in cell wall biosynthesis